MHFFKTLVPALLLFAAASQAASPADDAAATVVIYNQNDPEAKGLAAFYCSVRGIAPERLISIDAPVREEVTRDEFDSKIATPIRQELIRRGMWFVTLDMMNRPILYASTIRYAVLIRGVPLKVSQCTGYPGDARNQPAPYGDCNSASVDSELSVLGLFSPQISGTLNNPLYRNRLSSGDTESRLSPPLGMIMVSRLDAPTSVQVKNMLLAGIKAEREGLWGWGYIDLRSVGSQGYARGDEWIREAGAAMRRNGIPVLSDDLPETIQRGFPVTDAAAYYGWHAENIEGPFAESQFRFVPGAVAVHLHSFSASTLRDPQKGWVGPLIAHGASASLGNVYEPYLPFTTNLGVFAAALLSGRNLAESYYTAQPVLSWMSVCVGDPLYRPYAAFHTQESRAEENPWREYRKIILSHDGDTLAAATDLKARAEVKRESLYLEALGAAQLDSGDGVHAEESFREASGFTKDPAILFRLLLEQARSIEKQGRWAIAEGLLQDGLLHFVGADQQDLLHSWIKRMETSAAYPYPKKTNP
jgi:uncharacterized protein (TIGR03790 family)